MKGGGGRPTEHIRIPLCVVRQEGQQTSRAGEARRQKLRTVHQERGKHHMPSGGNRPFAGYIRKSQLQAA